MHKRSLEAVVGRETYSVWVKMLRALVPDGRTHRLSVLVAAMLYYAYTLVEGQEREDTGENSVARSLLESIDVSDVSEIEDLLNDVVARLFKDAGVGYTRTSSRSGDYSIIEDAFQEFIHWLDMPWEG
jgi:hypothetical protein